MREPEGIVRLADLVAAPAAVARASDNVASNAEMAPRAGGARTARKARRPPTDTAGGAGVVGQLRDLGKTPTPYASGVAPPAGLPRKRGDTAESDTSYAADPVGAAGQPPDATADGPAYEPLFGGDGDPRKRRQRPVRPPATPTQRALGLLTRREHSRKELTRKLVSRGVDAAEVEQAVDRLAAAGWQDDRRFAGSLVRARASAGYGPLHIRAELGTHDLAPEIRADALDGFEGDWAEIARDLATRRFARIEDSRLRERKAADFLIRRGFPGDVVRVASRFDPTGD